MKNIHLIPTDKPSRLFKVSGELKLTRNFDFYNGSEYQNIYITNDEEIKEGDWFYDLDTNYIKIKQSWENSHLDFNAKKIILTTDQDLINDGVQAIDDTFLQWFVKNQSCESVEVCKNPFYEESNYEYYKIIIPQEEPKQLNPKDFRLPIFGTKEFNNLCSKFMGGKPKQETLEEAAENYASKKLQRPITIYNPLESNVAEYVGFIEGAKWQAERMYSEEEVLDIINSFEKLCYNYQSNKDWFPAKKVNGLNNLKKK